MYLLITRNNPYLEELNKNPQSQAFQKDLDGMEIDLKNRLKVQEMDMKDCYDLDKDSDENSFSDEDESSKDSSLSLANSNIKPVHMGHEDEVAQGKQANQKKIINFKFYIHVIDVISSAILIITAIICQIENEKYYTNNIYTRIPASLLINNIYLNGKDNTWDDIFNDDNLNLTSMTEFEGISLAILSYKYMKNGGYYTQVKNKDILKAFNITRDKFNYKDNETDYHKIKVPLEISEENKNLRIAILALTIIGGVLVACSRYLEHIRQDYLIREEEIPFYKSKYSFFLLIEIILLLFFQYPGLNTYSMLSQLDCVMVLPISSLFSAFTVYRLIYILRIIKAITVWDSMMSEKICEKYSCTPGFIFSFKATQKNNPFLSLIILFFLSCICFGFSIRIFELHYWETQKELTQNWRYHWNALWCVFVSMTTVGYGDFYPKTHFGRVIIIISCVVGIYFISMMMIFMTQKSLLSESEQKAYKLITRLKLRNQLKEIHANMIYHALEMYVTQKKYNEKTIQDKEYKIKYNYEKRCIISIIDENKIISENIKSFDIIPTKEQLFDISERIETDIKDIRCEIEILQKMNVSFMGYTDTQVIMMKYLKKSIISTKLMYDLIEKKPDAFGELKNLDKNAMLEELEKVYKENEFLNKSIKAEVLFDKHYLNNNAGRRRTNPNQYDDLGNNNQSSTNIQPKNYDEFYAEELAKYQVTPEEFKEHFQSLFFDTGDNAKKAMKSNAMKTIKTIKNMKEMKKKIDADILMRRGGDRTIIDENSMTEQRSVEQAG